MIPALLILAQLTPVPAEPKAIATTIAALRANPKKYDGQVVRLHGYVSRCDRLSCSINEGQGTTGANLSIAPNQKFDETLKPLLPTYVEFDARFDASCRTKVVCIDRAPELTVVQLRSVVSPEPPEIEN